MRFGRRRADRLLLALAIVVGALAVLFVEFGSDVLEGDLAGADRSIREIAIDHRSPLGLAFSEFVTVLGSKPILVVIAIVASLWLSPRSKTAAVLLVLCAFASAELVDHLKENFEVARPPLGATTSRSFAFPSGHTSGAAAIVTLISYVSWRRGRALAIVLPAGVALVVLMALSRIYLDKHWLSDTIGGALIGVTVGLASSAIYEWISRRESRPDERIGAAVSTEHQGST